jgi:nicotinamide-nucleotide amidase
MTDNITAEIVAIGTEILLGEITDTNSVYIARALRDIGVNVYFMTSVGDNEGRITDSIRLALTRADVVITCGGLGPTVDDMTRQSVAAAVNRGLTFHQHLLDQIVARFATFRARMSDNNRRQAYLPDDSIVVENPVGTAPSFIVEHGDKVIMCLPGVPREMKYLLTESMIPFLRKHYHLGIIKAKVLKTAGIGESLLDDAIGEEILNMRNPSVGLAAHAGQVDVRVTAKAECETEADTMISVVESQIRERVGEYVFGEDNDKIETVLIGLMNELGLTVAVIETGVGDPVSRRLKSAVGSDTVVTSVKTFSHPDDLREVLDGWADLPIRSLAESVARHASENGQASTGIAVVCRPEMDEIHADSEGGTAIAVFVKGNVRSRIWGFGGQSESAQSWSGTWAMSMLWQMLREI